MTIPPSTLITCPVTNAEMSLAKKNTAPATSAGWPKRFSGVCCFAKSGTYVRVSEADWLRLGDHADRVARRVGGQGYMRMVDGHCVALHVTTTRRGEPPRFFCELYEQRPQVCRDLARGCFGINGNVDDFVPLHLVSHPH